MKTRSKNGSSVGPERSGNTLDLVRTPKIPVPLVPRPEPVFVPRPSHPWPSQSDEKHFEESLDYWFTAYLWKHLARPYPDRAHIDGDIYALVGDSLFVASRVVNFETLIELIGPAPHGVALAPVNRQIVLYTVISPRLNSLVQAMELASAVTSIVAEDELDGGILSDTVLYWAPDGRVEYLARLSMLVDDEPTITVLPGPAFCEYTGIEMAGDGCSSSSE